MSDSQPIPPIQLLQPGAPPAEDPLIGQKVGEYVVEAPIAAGGMGMVSDKEQADRFLQADSPVKCDKVRVAIDAWQKKYIARRAP